MFYNQQQQSLEQLIKLLWNPFYMYNAKSQNAFQVVDYESAITAYFRN